MRFKWMFACLPLLVVLPPVCDGTPIKDNKKFRYEVSVQLGSESIVLTSIYTCILDGPLLSERGPIWQISPEAGDDIRALGRSESGIELQAQPKGIVMPDAYCDAYNKSGITRTVGSRLFFRQHGANTYRSVDFGETRTADFGDVRITSSTVTRLHSGYSFGSPRRVHNADGAQYWYSISATSRSIDEIDTTYQTRYRDGYNDRGLQSYLKSQHQLWIGENTLLPFDAYAREDLSPSFRYRNQLWPFPAGGADVVMEKSNGSSWHVSRAQEWIALPGRIPNLAVGSTNFDALATVWIDFERSRIEFPMAELAWRYVYEPSTNRVVTFRMDLVTLMNQ